MPTVKRQTPGEAPAPPTGGILSRRVSAKELDNKFIKMLVYGQNRVGKTTLACQFPKPLLLVALEPNQTGGANSIKSMDGVDVIVLDHAIKEINPATGEVISKKTVAQQVRELAQELKNDTYYKTIVLDSATSLQEWVLVEIKGWDEPPVQKAFDSRADTGVTGDEYRMRSEETRKLLWPFMMMRTHTVLTGKEKDHNPPKEEKYTTAGKPIPDMRPRFLRGMQQESFIAADIGGGTLSWLHDCCDYICRMYFAKEVVRDPGHTIEVNGQKIQTGGGERETGKFVRCLRTQYHPNYAGGFRSCTPDRVPEFIELHNSVNGYEVVKAAIDGLYPISEEDKKAAEESARRWREEFAKAMAEARG